MRAETLDILRCPYCGGRLALATAQFHTLDGDDLVDGVLGCHCCAFPVVAGIPVLHLQPAASKALGHLGGGRADLALLSMFELDENPALAERFTALAEEPTSTYRDVVDALGSTFEGGYFLYRFSDPTFVVAEAVVQAVAATVLREGGRAVDVCGGSGHLTRTLGGMSSPAPVLADLYFSKTWLGRRFTTPGCEAVACDGNSPLPFARGAFRYAMCSDAFMYIWTKRQFVQEMLRLTDTGDTRTAVVINHTHNQLTWSPSHGQALPPSGYRDLFETIEPRLFAEANLLADVVSGGPLDLARRDDQATLEKDAALTLIASRDPRVFARHPLAPATEARGEYRINPMYRAQADGERVRLQLHFPSEDYEQEYGACRRYLEGDLIVDSDTLGLLPAASASGRLADLARRRAILDLPKRYY